MQGPAPSLFPDVPLMDGQQDQVHASPKPMLTEMTTLTARGGDSSTPGTRVPNLGACRLHATPHCRQSENLVILGTSSGCLWLSPGPVSADPGLVCLQAWAPTGVSAQYSGLNWPLTTWNPAFLSGA